MGLVEEFLGFFGGEIDVGVDVVDEDFDVLES